MKKEIIILGSLIVIFWGLLFFLYEKPNDIDNIRYKLNQNSNIAIMVYDEERNTYLKQSDIPVGKYNINEEKSSCVNGGSIFDYNASLGTIKYNFSTADKCYLYFDVSRTISDTVIALADGTEKTSSQTDGGIYRVIDQNGIRYQGKDPDNYVIFNGDETWRIIGTFEGSTIGLESGKYYTKLIKNEAIAMAGRYLNSNAGNWETSGLNLILSGVILEEMEDTAKEMIAYATHYLGGVSAYNSYTSAQFYAAERGSAELSSQNYLGLMYISDYGYAMYAGSANSACTTESTLIYAYRTAESNCAAYDWLFFKDNEWVITSTGNEQSVFYINSNGEISVQGTSSSVFVSINQIRPTLYLDSSVTVSGGSGTSDDPYTLQ